MFSERRSARDSNSIARRIAAKPLPRSSLSLSSTQSPPDRLPKITASTIWMSRQPCSPAAPTWRRIAAPRPLGFLMPNFGLDRHPAQVQSIRSISAVSV